MNPGGTFKVIDIGDPETSNLDDIAEAGGGKWRCISYV